MAGRQPARSTRTEPQPRPGCQCLAGMRLLLACAFLAGCGGVDDGPDATTLPPQSPPAATEQADGLGLHDAAGPVPGLPGFAFAWTADVTRCGGVRVGVMRDPSAVLVPGDQELAALFETSYPAGLDFSSEASSASRIRFQSWLERTKAGADAAAKRYEPQLASTDPAIKAAAHARLVQIPRYFASQLVRAEHPVDIQSGEFASEKQYAFCETLAKVALPLLEKAKQAASTCATFAASAPAGWWTSICY